MSQDITFMPEDIRDMYILFALLISGVFISIGVMFYSPLAVVMWLWALAMTVHAIRIWRRIERQSKTCLVSNEKTE